MSKAVVFFAEGFEEIEAVTIVDVLRRGGINVETVSISDTNIVKGAHNISISTDFVFDNRISEIENSDIIILPGGGLGTDNLKKHTGVNEIAEKFTKSGKYVAAICAAPSVLGIAGLLNTHTAVCYPGIEKQLFGAFIGEGNVVVDGKFITSKGPATAMEFSLKILEVLAGKEKSDEIRKDLLF